MPEVRYALKFDKKKAAYAAGRNLPVSYKWCVEIGMAIKGKDVEKAKKILEDVINLKRAVPIKRAKTHVAHKPGKMAAGRFPIKAAKAVLVVLESAIKNAENRGFDEKKLYVKNVWSTKGISFYRPRIRWRPQRAKTANLQIVLEER